MSANQLATIPQKAWVVFSGQTDLAWLRLLKPGFRHCFVLLNDGRRWLTFDPLSNYTDICVHHDLPAGYNLPQWLEGQGFTVVQSVITQEKKPAPFMIFTCVEAVKRVLGLHRFFIFTPWQLYRHLTTHNTNEHHRFKGELSWEV